MTEASQVESIITKNLGFIFKVQMALSIVTAGILKSMLPTQSVISFFIGALLITINFWLLVILWKRVFSKKQVAMTLFLVITKYASLGVLLFLLINKWSLPIGPFLAGTTTLFGAFVILALRVFVIEKNNNAL